MRNAYAMSQYAEAKEALQKLFRRLERINPSTPEAVLRPNWTPPTRLNPACPRFSGRRERKTLARRRLAVALDSRRKQFLIDPVILNRLP
jgi:hypothetical protein